MKKITAIAAIAGLMLIVGGLERASAATLTYTDTITSQDTDWNELLDFAKFDSTQGVTLGGTLESVTIQFVASGSTVITVTNQSETQGSSGNARTQLTLTLLDPDSLFGSDLEIGGLFPPGAGASSFNLGIGGQVIKGPYAISLDSGEIVYTTSQVLAEFTGTGNISLAATASALTNLTVSGGNTLASQETEMGATVIVTYTYTVPEPTTALLLGAGGVWMLMARRRRSA